MPLRHTEIVDQKFCAVGDGEMIESLQVRLPIADVLVVNPVNDVLAQDKLWLIHLRRAAEQARGNQVCLVDHSALIAPARRTHDLLAQPQQVYFELRQHGGRGEIPGERLVTVQ